ncbi:MAG TPA: NAD-dependent epimerase/dehydratase family protein [Candidatus Dormibacteraeota bacterium]|nr:NAD-dependent epimerase/dehydratase family protein [Candidatus Dormibacteraeota bacterium]
MTATCLVTGSAGFIGSRLTHSLLDDGWDVVGVDACTDSYDQAEKHGRAALLERRHGYRHVTGDLVDLPLDAHLRGVTTIFHLAGRAGVRDSFQLLSKYRHDNVEATARLLDSARRTPSVRRLVYASSSSVYGDAALPLRETARPGPISPYGQTKLDAERLCLAASTAGGLEAVALRYFTVYGPGQRPDMALRRFIEAAIAGRPLHLYGDGSQSRDFTYVDDIVAATRSAAEAPADGIAINVGGGSRITLSATLELLAAVVGRPLVIERTAAVRGDVQHTWADLTRADRLLGFRPRVDLRQGLAAEADWLRASAAIQRQSA